MTNQIRYLCVDDETDTETEGYLDFIKEQYPSLNIALQLPRGFETEVSNLQKEISNGDFQGLILDLQLNGKGSLARYRAPALVQEIHTLVAENAFPIRPLVLWSNDDKMNTSYLPDDTSHDLFDLTIRKEKLADGNKHYARKIARRLVALAVGYELLTQEVAKSGQSRAFELLGISDEVASELDPRILVPLTLPLNETSAYEQARFIHRQLLATPNYALIDAEVLAARLGLNLDEVTDFEALVEELFPNSRYQGVFANGWVCWWVPLLEKAWLALPHCPGPLRDLTAEQRIACIEATTGRQGLKPARPIELASSTAFWTICQATRRPLDPLEGYVVDRQLYPWQLTQYISLHGKLDRGKGAERIKIDALDWERFNEDKDGLKQSQQL